MKHSWKDYHSDDILFIIFRCQRCKRGFTIAKVNCDFNEPDDEFLERRGINSNCDIEIVRSSMNS